MNKIFMYTGLPGAGKSRFYALGDYEYGEHKYISSDEVRWEMYLKDDPDYSKVDNEKVFNEVHKQIEDALVLGFNVVFDATNLNRKKRMHFIRKFNKYDVEALAFVVDIINPHWVMAERAESEDEKDLVRIVPPKQLSNMYISYEVPTLSEGFSKISYLKEQLPAWELFDKFLAEFKHVKSKTDLHNFYYDETINPLLLLTKDFDQESKWHTDTLDDHIYKVFEHMFVNLDEDKKYIALAGLFHDVGKLVTKQVGEDGQGHYYNHEKMSGQLFIMNCEVPMLNAGYTKEEIDMVLWLTINHMYAYNPSLKKVEERFPQGIDYLKLLHEGDQLR